MDPQMDPIRSLNRFHNKMKQTSNYSYRVQSRFSDIKFSDNLWFSDYFTKTIFQFTT